MNFANKSVCLMADNVWNEVINFVDYLIVLCFMASPAVHAWEFVYYLSVVGSSYQLH
jgi:hypothetical protein